MEAARKLPERNVPLETVDATFYFFKADTLAGTVTYSSDRRMAANLVTITAERAKDIIELNAVGEKPFNLIEEETAMPQGPIDLAEQDDLTRFDKSKRKNNRNKRQGKERNGNNRNRERNEQRGERNEQRGARDNNRRERNEQRGERNEQRDNAAPRRENREQRDNKQQPNRPATNGAQRNKPSAK